MRREYKHMYSRQGIKTKAIPASDTRGARIKASTVFGFSCTVPYNYECPTNEGAHWEAVKALINKHNLHWGLDWVCGVVDDKGYVFVPIGGVGAPVFGVNVASVSEG